MAPSSSAVAASNTTNVTKQPNVGQFEKKLLASCHDSILYCVFLVHDGTQFSGDRESLSTFHSLVSLRHNSTMYNTIYIYTQNMTWLFFDRIH